MSHSTDLRALIAEGSESSLLDALDLALSMSLARVDTELDYKFLEDHAETAEAFFAQWLPKLGPLERLSAANWVASQYVLSMVHLPHSYGTAAKLVLAAHAAAAQALADSMNDFGYLTHGPDAEVSPDIAAELGQLAQPVSEAAAGVRRLIERVESSAEAAT